MQKITMLWEFVNQIKLADTHEHLVPEAIRNQIDLDFTYLMPVYVNSDLISAGLAVDDLEKIRKPGRAIYQALKESIEPGIQTYPFKERLPDKDYTLDEKWDIFAPYWEKVKNTGYAKSILKSLKVLFQIDDLNKDSYRPLSAALQQSRVKGWYEEVLLKKSGIDFCLVDNGITKMDQKFFYPSIRFDRFIYIPDQTALNRLEFDTGTSITCLTDLHAALRKDIKSKYDSGMRSIKVGLAYRRPLYFENVSAFEAEIILDRLFTHPSANLSWHESKSLQDFMLHALIRAAVDLNLPIQFHTGIQTGNGNVVENSHPNLLTNLFLRYKRARFDIFHAGYPYHSELAILAKTFINVYANLCWLPIISPWMAERVLHEWLETIPISKIFAFGGDYPIVEGVLGQAIVTRQIVANVLDNKVKAGYFTENEACEYAEKILLKNAKDFYQI